MAEYWPIRERSHLADTSFKRPRPTLHINMKPKMAREIHALMKRDGMKPSEFFRSLYDQAVAARLPVVEGERR